MKTSRFISVFVLLNTISHAGLDKKIFCCSNITVLLECCLSGQTSCSHDLTFFCVCVCVLPVSHAMTYTLMSVSPSLAGGHFMSDALGCVFDRQQSRGASVSIKQHQSRENRTLTDIRVNIGPLFSGGLQPVSICNVDAANAGFT